jgi:hypothetical protein
MAALLVTIPLVTSWILARRVPGPRQVKELTAEGSPDLTDGPCAPNLWHARAL